MKCPKCGHDQPDKSIECERCGIIFSKWREKVDRQKSGSIKTAPPSPSPVYRQVAKPTDTLFYAQILIFLLVVAGGGYWIYSSLNDWREFTSNDKWFSIQFVGDPVMETDSAEIDTAAMVKGRMATTYYHTSPALGIIGIEYMVMVADFTILGDPGSVEWNDTKAYQGFREGVLSKLGWAARVESERSVEIAGQPGREWVFKARAGKVTVQLFRDGNRMCAIAVAHPPMLSLQEEKERFFGSFQLL
jgi:hypothetical protein